MIETEELHGTASDGSLVRFESGEHGNAGPAEREKFQSGLADFTTFRCWGTQGIDAAELNVKVDSPARSKLLSMAATVALTAIAAVGRQVCAEDVLAGTRESGELARQVQQELDHEASHERLWWYGWMTFNGGFTVGQGIAAGLSGDRGSRADLGVGAATSFLGVIGMLISPLPEIDTASKTLRAMPSDGEEAGRARDEAAITLREQASNVERGVRSWVAHVLNVVVAGGSSLVLWKGFDRGSAAATNFPVSIAVGELQILTQPAALIGNSHRGLAAASPPEVPAAPQRSLGLAWSGGLMRVILAF